MKEIVLSVKELTVYRESYAAVQDVSFSLESGTDTSIVGPNGGGKTTLVQAILGILPRHSGEIFILGQPLTRKGFLPSRLRQQIAYLPQNFLVDRRIPMTVDELVGLGWDRLGFQLPWANRKKRDRAVRDALARVNGSHLRTKLIGGLSGGETKRMLLAYCLVYPRRLLILDEAPAGLDIRAESEFYQLLYQLKQEQNWAILQISHDLDMVRQHCDRVLCINRTLRCQGTPEVALSPDSLSALYGTEFARYHHSH
ncbi:metal ABC transporter ATP-binding protein [Brunnivagina elsteri]|uniref:ABC transporter ATP-binding protein n=1 Tax=Brunnivagina elsteri CCALA 953 TaxID=987040 RepID=A0A2A2TN47_9CYAN|nr:metal ABC transporter ATP-binding protein [Calothrix elsteri]PAX59530.1 ABC transporter ATP-binding protein [Calothrix elsteri CCALA 953]